MSRLMSDATDNGKGDFSRNDAAVIRSPPLGRATVLAQLRDRERERERERGGGEGEREGSL